MIEPRHYIEMTSCTRIFTLETKLEFARAGMRWSWKFEVNVVICFVSFWFALFLRTRGFSCSLYRDFLHMVSNNLSLHSHLWIADATSTHVFLHKTVVVTLLLHVTQHLWRELWWKIHVEHYKVGLYVVRIHMWAMEGVGYLLRLCFHTIQ